MPVSIRKLLPNQVLVTDGSGVLWIFDITDVDDWEIIRARATKDADGNYVLSLPLFASLKKWTMQTAFDSVDRQMQDLGVPQIPEPQEKAPLADLSQLNNVTRDELSNILLKYGAYRSYLEVRLSDADSKQTMAEQAFESAMDKMMATVLLQDSERKMTKEVLRAESLALNPQLKKLRQDVIEWEGLVIRLKGLRDGYKAAYDAVSRVVALRVATREEM